MTDLLPRLDYSDLSTYHHGGPPLPSWVRSIRPHQAEAVAQIMEAYDNGADVVFLDAPTGCLHGDTELIVNRAGKGFRISIRDFVYKFNGGQCTIGRGRKRLVGWDMSIPSEVAYSDGALIRKMVVRRAFSTGVKECWKLTTTDGNSIIASAEHPLFEREGGWTELLHLEAGMQVAIRGDRGGSAGPKRRDPYRANLVLHPNARCKGTTDPHSGHKVALHRLIFEAFHLNEMSLNEFVRRCRVGPVEGLSFLDPYLEVHHIDHDHTNNDPGNLTPLTPGVHRSHHADESTVLFRQEWAEVESIEPVGEHETFDLTMIDAPHSYIANGFVVHNSGKTLVAELVRRMLGSRGVYVCSDKSLQRQFSRDFPYARELMGRSNYLTMNGPASVSCDDCTSIMPGDSCLHCDPTTSCPYKVAKGAALTANLAVLNTSYLLSAANFTNSFTGEQFIIVDEADALENTLLGFVEYKVPNWVQRRIGMDYPKKGVHKKTLVAWMNEAADKVADDLRKISQSVEPKMLRTMQSFVATTRQVAGLVAKDIEADAEAEDTGKWLRVYDDGDASLHLKPVLVGPFGTKNLWKHGRKWLLMSATLVSVDELVETLGLPLEYATVSVPSTFPVENRPIIVAPIADMSYKASFDEYTKMAYAIQQVCALHPGERVLVHTVSRDRAEKLIGEINMLGGLDGRKIIEYRSSRERDSALARYKERDGAVLFAQSMVRGVDLPGDLCRVQIIAKVPFPSLGDKRVSARVHLPGGQSWLVVQAIRDIVQMTGRGVRSDTDHATCTWPEALVLKRDLTWVRADELVVGDEMWGFDESTSRTEPRRWRPAVVQATGISELDRLRVTMADGSVIVVTPNHRFVSKWGQAKDDSWVRADQLRPGHSLNRYIRPWITDDTRSGGYLSGILDGEGHLALDQGNRNRSVMKISIAQKPGLVMDQIHETLRLSGFDFAEYGQKAHDCRHVDIKGGLAEQMRMLGQYRPVRLLDKLLSSDWAGRFQSVELAPVVDVTNIGPGPMVTLQSSTETYITDGFGSHNTYIFDRQFSTNLYRPQYRPLFPAHWRNAVDRSRDVRQFMMGRNQ